MATSLPLTTMVTWLVPDFSHVSQVISGWIGANVRHTWPPLICQTPDSWMADIRGFGRSLGGEVMAAPAQANSPYARLPEAAVDVRTAVNFILARESCAKLDLLGFSWGTVTTAYLAAQAPTLINRLVLYAPLYAERNEEWLDRMANPSDGTKVNPAMGAYRYVTAAELVERWNKDMGERPVHDATESYIPQLIFDALAVLDPMSTARSPLFFSLPFDKP